METDTQLRIIIDNLPAMVWTARPDGFRDFINRRWLEYTGLSFEEALGTDFVAMHPEDQLEFLGQWKRTVQTGTPIEREIRLRRADGEYFWFLHRIVPFQDESGKVLKWIATITDIHALKRSEESLRDEQKRIESARLQTEEKYRNVVETATDAVISIDEKSEIVFVNPATTRTFGYAASELVGQKLTILMPESMRKPHRAGLQRYVKTGQRHVNWQGTEFTALRKNGEEFPVEVSFGVAIKNGKPVFTGFIRDISEREQAKAKLRESEERFRNVADTAPVMIWVTDPDKQFIFFNKTWLNFTGRTMEQELGAGWAAGVYPDDQQRYYQTFSSAFDARRNFQIECRLRRADGEYRSVLCSGVPRFARGGIFAGYIGSDMDITDLQSEERFRQLAENIDQVFWMLDLATNQVLYVSPAFEKVWGRSSISLYQNHDSLVEAVHAEDRDRFVSFLEKMRAEPIEESYRIVRPDGSVRWIHDRAFLVSDPEGKPYRVAGIAEDVTVQRELEEQLRQAHKMEAIGRLAGGIAHDFNNLLMIIGGYSQMLLEGTHSEQTRRERLEQILAAANRASILTRQLLAFSRRQVLQPRLVDVNRLLANMEALLRRVIGEHITVETALDPALSRIKTDPNQLEQVVMNLAANARDAMRKAGLFRIETSMADATDKQAEDCPCRTGRCVRLRISDTGCGMDTRTRERAFEPFFTTKGLGKGTGLGLSTVYGIVRQNHGSIHVWSEPGQGTIFDIHFPAVSEGEGESERPASRLPKTRPAATVLVAEDESAVRGLIRLTLEPLGYTVLEAADGYEAVQLIEQHHSEIHLLLTDVIMPLMNGYELAKRLGSISPATKVLYMSGYTDEVLAFHGIAKPEIDFIQKPVTPSELAEKVETMLSKNEEKPIPAVDLR